MKAKQFRVQLSEAQGVYRNCYRRGIKWGPWRTVAAFPTMEEARADCARRIVGLHRKRVVHGATVVLD